MNTFLHIDRISAAILKRLLATPHQATTIECLHREITEKTNYPTVFRRIESLLSQGFISKTKYGSASQVLIDFNEQTMHLLSLLEVRKREEFLINSPGSLRVLTESIRSVPQKAGAILIFGSYAKGTAQPSSDLDLLLIHKHPKTFQESFEKTFKGLQLRSTLEINPIIIDEQEYRQMILDSRPNVGKEAYLDHVILYGAYWYWSHHFAIETGDKGAL